MPEPKADYVENSELERARVALGRLVLWVHRHTQLTSAEILNILDGVEDVKTPGP